MEIIDGTKVFDHHDAITALRAVVQGREDFIYTDSQDYRDVHSCMNWSRDHESEPWRASCVVGHVLTAWGFPEELKGDSRYNGVNVTLSMWPGARVTDHAKAVLVRAQNTQDTCYTWGEALKAAEEAYAETDQHKVQAILDLY